MCLESLMGVHPDLRDLSEADLERKLLSMLLGDRDKIERLVLYESSRQPGRNRRYYLAIVIESIWFDMRR